MKDKIKSKLLDRLDEFLTTSENKEKDIKKVLQESPKLDNELLQTEDNKKLIEKYLNKMGVKEKVNQKILEGKSNEVDTNQKGKDSPSKNKNPSQSRLSINFSTTKEKDGLHKKVNLHNMTKDGQDEKKPDLAALIKKKKISSRQKPNSPRSNSHVSLDILNNSQHKYRKTNIFNEEESREEKLKATIIQLKKTIEHQKNENSKLNKNKKDNEKYITKLEAVLNDEIVRKGSKNNININFSSTSLTNNRINNFFSDSKRIDQETKNNNYLVKLREFYFDSVNFSKRVGEIIKEIENTAHGVKLYLKENYNSASLSVKKDNSTMSALDEKFYIIKVNENMENIIRVMKGNFNEFQTKIDTKYNSLATTNIKMEDNVAFTLQNTSTKNGNKPKNKITEINHSKIKPKNDNKKVNNFFLNINNLSTHSNNNTSANLELLTTKSERQNSKANRSNFGNTKKNAKRFEKLATNNFHHSGPKKIIRTKKMNTISAVESEKLDFDENKKTFSSNNVNAIKVSIYNKANFKKNVLEAQNQNRKK